MTRLTKRMRTGVKDVMSAARLRLNDAGLMFHLQDALREIKLAYYLGKLAAWKDALAYLKKESRYSVEVSRVAEEVQRMVTKIEKDVSTCE